MFSKFAIKGSFYIVPKTNGEIVQILKVYLKSICFASFWNIILWMLSYICTDIVIVALYKILTINEFKKLYYTVEGDSIQKVQCNPFN